MAKPLVFQLGDEEIALQLYKVDRSRLYGSKEVEALDENDQACELATLADDGRTIIGRGGTAFGWLDADGKWCDKSELKPVDTDGELIQPVASSFSKPIKLFETSTVEHYLQHNIRLVYELKLDDVTATSETLDALRSELVRGTIFNFPYSYRGGLEADAAFLLANEDNEIMLAVGTLTELAFVGIQSQVLAVDADEAPSAEDADSMDFDMI